MNEELREESDTAEGFTSREVIDILNGGCLCTLGRGTCQHHATTEPGRD